MTEPSGQPTHRERAALDGAGPASDDALRGNEIARDAAIDGHALEQLRDARLFARAAAGDRSALEEVWTANRRWIAAVLAGHAPASADLEDLLQEVAATLLSKCRNIRDSASLRGWLRAVAVNAARMSARKRATDSRAREGFAQTMRASDRAETTRASVDGHESEELRWALARIPAQYAEPLLLQATQGLSQRQIAMLLDVPETTVETRLARGRRMLRNLLEESRTAVKEPGGARKAIGGCSDDE